MKKVINTLLVFAVIIPFVLLFCSLVYLFMLRLNSIV